MSSTQWKLLIGFAGLVACMMGSLVYGEPPVIEQASGPIVDPSRAFRVATHNLNWGNRDLKATVTVIRTAEADLVVLQETTAKSEAYFRRHLTTEYPWIHFQGYQGRYAAERFGILSTVEVRSLRFLPPRHGLFGTWLAEVELGGRRLQFANVHLQPPMLSRRSGSLRSLEALNDMEDVHRKEIAAIHAVLDADLPALVLGDFNSMANLPAGAFLVEKGFVDSFASVTDLPEAHPTWHWRTRLMPLTARIDHIFHTRQMQTIASRVVSNRASDHDLLVSRMQWVAVAPR